MIEADVPMIMRIGFGFITLIFIVAIILLFRKTRNKVSLFLFGIQWGFTTLSFHFLLDALRVSPWNTPLNTENVSYSVGLCGIFWGLSICFMLIGIHKSVSVSKTAKK